MFCRCIYTAIAVVATVQSARMYHATRWLHWLPLSQHLLIIGVGVTRGFAMAMFWKLQATIALAAQVFLAALPYLFYPWSVPTSSARRTRAAKASPQTCC